VIAITGAFPTASLETTRASFSSLPPGSLIHSTAYLALLLIFPYCIIVLSRSLAEEKLYPQLLAITRLGGMVCCFLCYAFLFLFISRIPFGYFGLLQRIIIGLYLVWFFSCARTISSRAS